MAGNEPDAVNPSRLLFLLLLALGVNGSVALVVAKDATKVVGRNFDVDGYPVASLIYGLGHDSASVTPRLQQIAQEQRS